MANSESKRAKLNRNYFESGCYCIITKKIKKLAPEVSDQNAIAYYESACTCNRNYIDESNKGTRSDSRNNGPHLG